MAQSIDLPDVPADPHPRVPRWLPDVVVSVLIVLAAFGKPQVPDLTSTGPIATALMLAPIVILPWRRRHPLAVLIALLAVFGATAAVGTLSVGVAIAVGVAMFNVSIRGPRTRVLVVGGCSVTAIMLLTLPVVLDSVLDPRVFQFGLIVAFAAAAGDGARSRRAYIAAIKERAERAVETRETEARRRVSEERLRIARDLHDAVAHQIAVISLHAGVASSMIDSRPDRAKESMGTIRTAARTVLGEIGDLMTMLRANDDGDTPPVPQSGLDRLDDLVAQFAASGLDVRTRIEGDLDRVSGTVSLVAYRVVREALTNAHKHGSEHRAHVLVHAGADELTVAVTNPMESDEPDRRERASSGLGLIGLRERVASVRGTVDVGPDPAGWKVRAWMPLTNEEARP